MKRITIVLVSVLLLTAVNANAVTSYIGDADGFGWGAGTGLLGADHKPVERNATGLLDSGDVLPDINQNNTVATGSGDDWDNRSGAEASDPYAKWTDVTLSTSFGGRPGLADNASFVFNFAVPELGDPDFGVDHYVNLVYGDYDVNPMSAVVEGYSVPLLDNQAGGVDGYIWRAYAPVAWADMLDGQVTLDIVAPGEPYVVFDYALLDVEPLSTGHTIPAPGAIVLGALGAGLVGWLRRRRTL